jgi:hypothetical protein
MIRSLTLRKFFEWGRNNMKMRTILLLLSLFISTAYAHDESNSNAGAVLNKDGSIVTGILAPVFAPSEQDVAFLPLPHNLAFNGTGDLTLNIDGADPADFSDPLNVLGALDGFSTTEKWLISFTDRFEGPGSIDPSTVIPGFSVRVFQVTAQQFLFVTGIVRELVAGVDFVAAVVAPGVVAIIPLKPLAEYSNFMAVLTNDIKDMDGNDATPGNEYHLTKSHTPWIDANFQSVTPLLSDASAQALEGLRQITNSMEAAAGAAGIDHDDISLSYTVQTQSISPSLRLLRSIAQPAPTTIVPTPLNTTVVGGAGIADILMGVITLPYYLGIPSAANPIAPLTDFWTAPPGGYVPPFDQFGFDPTSTHITAINPFPVLTGMQTVPVLMTVPNASSGMTKPATGWPVVIFGHGLGGNRTQALAIADTLASIGYACIAIDTPLHGVNPDTDPLLAGFYIENTPFGPLANERTFDVDYLSNTTGAPGPDGMKDASGAHIINLASLLTTRDNARQGVADLSVLAVSIPTISIDGDSVPDLDGSNISYAALSMGSVLGAFIAIEPLVSRAYLSVGGGGVARFLDASVALGPRIHAGLAAAGIVRGTADYELFLTIAQSAMDSADIINWSREIGETKRIMLHEVIGDVVIPNFVATAPLSGTEPMIRVMGLTSYSTSQANPDGLKAVARFVPPATHGSWLSPALGSPAATFEMQSQMASFIASFGTFINVTDETTMVQVLGLSEMLFSQPMSNAGPGKKGRSPRRPVLGPTWATASPYNDREGMNND